MAYDKHMVERVQIALAGGADVRECNMFGSRGFMVDGKLAVCVRNGDMMFKLGPEQAAAALAAGEAEPMIMGNRRMKGWVLIGNSRLDDEALYNWLDQALRQH